ncbi:MAG: hypothetical protein MZW92_67190 [Comamonadaceae bacterium]|nr:hypothetical protein [Comamonadaceae bacterium]
MKILDDPQAGRAARRLPRLFQGRLDQRAAGHHRQRPRPRAPDVQGHRGHGRHRLRQGIRDRRPDRRAHEPGLPGEILEDRRRRGPDRGLAEGGRRAGQGPEGLHHQGRPLDAVHEERRHRAQRLDEPGDDGLLRHPAVEQDRAPDAHGVRPDDERPLPRVLFREGRHHGGAPAEREPAGLSSSANRSRPPSTRPRPTTGTSSAGWTT